MRYESLSAGRRSFIRSGMRPAFAFSLAGHLSIAVVLVSLEVRPRAPHSAQEAPIAIRILESEPTPATEPASEGILATETEPKRSPHPRVHLGNHIAPPAAGLAPPAGHAGEEGQVLQVASSATTDETGIQPFSNDSAILAAEPTTAPTVTTAVAETGTTHASASGSASDWNSGGSRWDLIREAIQRHVVYPSRGRRMGWQGKVVVTFVLKEDGHVQEARVLASSGFPALDTSALQAVERATPLPQAGAPVQIVMPIVFGLR